MNFSINEMKISIDFKPKILKPIELLYEHQQQKQQENLSMSISYSQPNVSPSFLIEKAPFKTPKLPSLSPIRIQRLIAVRNQRPLRLQRRLELRTPQRIDIHRPVTPPRAENEPQQQLPPPTPIERPFLLDKPMSPIIPAPIYEVNNKSPQIQLPKRRRQRQLKRCV